MNSDTLSGDFPGACVATTGNNCAAVPLLDSYRLEDRYTRQQGRVFMTGTQALVRLPMMQRQLDERDGLNTAGFVSGYRGSPLGGYDQALWQAGDLLKQHNIEFEPGINEDLAASMVVGTQQVEFDQERQVDGVFALWYGKGPGVDRASDALKHGNAFGSSPHGGVLVVAGDDHGCVSSSMPHQSDVAFMAWFMPTLNPASVAEYFEFGLWGIALSRFSGAWVGFKAISETVESGRSIELPSLPHYIDPEDYTPPADGLHYRWPDLPGPHIETRMQAKLEAVQAFARANPIDRRLYPCPNARFGIVTTGKAHLDLLEALKLLELDETRLAELGIELYKVGMVWPLERRGILDFVHGKQEVLVIEEKRGIIESQIKEYMAEPDHPGEVLITGKQDEQGQPMISFVGELSPSILAPLVAARLTRLLGTDFGAQLQRLSACRVPQRDPGGVRRLPYFCSGCPHNTSTRVPEGSKAQAGIGCHVMASWMGRNTESLIQMGGEGVNWAGKARFTGNGHIFQNLGEGTYFHSGSMAIRQAVAAGVNITYKILFNDAVAMTGGQPVDGVIDVPTIARQVQAEGVKRICVVSDEPDKYRASALFPTGCTLHHRDELDAIQRELRQTPGVTVLIYDQVCAAEKRRRRKRGQLSDPARRVYINHHVCDDCGNCAQRSNCLSVIPRATALGRKRRIDQSSCNKDFTCLNGFCPSFVTIEGGQLRRPKAIGSDPDMERLLEQLPEPAGTDLVDCFDLLISGVGGTGIVTIGALITMAAHLEGKGASVLDFMGFAQKGGAVLSYVRLAPKPAQLHQVRIDQGRADALIACDLVVATSDKALDVLRHQQTRAVVNRTEIPTADYVLARTADMNAEQRLALIAQAVGEEHFASLEANQLAEVLLGDTLYANVLTLGYAWQQGLVPVSLPALRRAIELNGVAVEQNLCAFDWGRLAASTPAYVALRTEGAAASVSTLPSTLDERIQHYQEILSLYQDQAWADRYCQLVAAVRAVDARLGRHGEVLSEAVAEQAFRMMSPKDEYEVARLYTETDFLDEIRARFEGDYRLYFHLSPPLIEALGKGCDTPRKRRIGDWVLGPMRWLARLRRLRNTAFDPFRLHAHRQLERRLQQQYFALIEELIQHTRQDNYDTAVALARLPEHVRGYGAIKAKGAALMEAERVDLLQRFRAPRPPSQAVA